MPNDSQPYPGKPCPLPGCDGILFVESTRICGDNRRRYFKCRKCGQSPQNNIQSLPLRYAPQQPRRRRSFLV